MTASAQTPSHLTRAFLDSYLAADHSAVDLLARSAAHLEETCSGCRRGLPAESERLERLLAAAGAGLRTSLDQLAAEREAAPTVALEVAALAHYEALLRSVRDPRCHTLAFVEHHLFLAGLCLDRGLVEAGEEALTLVATVIPRIEPARYGWGLIREAEADAWVLDARCHLAKGELPAADRRLSSASALATGRCSSPALEADILFTRGGLRVAQRRDLDAWQLFDDVAAGMKKLGLWLAIPGVVAAAAWMERRLGRPAAAAARLVRFFEEWREAPASWDEWWAARELIAALCDLGGDRVPVARQAVIYLATWSLPEPDDGRGRARQDLEREAQLGYLEGLFANRIGGEPARAEPALVRARNLFLYQERGIDAALAILELVRLLLERGDTEPARRVAGDLEAVALCPDVQGAALAQLVRFAERVIKDKVGATELRALEDFLHRARAGWLPAAEDHEPP
jgi:hypothetical protein